MHEIMRKLDVAQEVDLEWLQDWQSFGQTDGERLANLLKGTSRPLAAAQSVFATMAVRNAMEQMVGAADAAMTTEVIAHVADLDRATVERILHGTFQADESWAWGRQREDGEWEWMLDTRAGDSTISTNFEGHDLFTADGRMQAARKLLTDMGVEIPIEEISPAMAFFKSMVDFGRFEGAFMGLLRSRHRSGPRPRASPSSWSRWSIAPGWPSSSASTSPISSPTCTCISAIRCTSRMCL